MNDEAEGTQPAPDPKRVTPLFGAYLAIGIGAGTAIGVGIDNLALGIGIGVAFGTAMGLIIDSARRRAAPAPGDESHPDA